MSIKTLIRKTKTKIESALLDVPPFWWVTISSITWQDENKTTLALVTKGTAM